MQVAEEWTVKDGKIASARPFYWDTTELVRAVTPAAGPAA